MTWTKYDTTLRSNSERSIWVSTWTMGHFMPFFSFAVTTRLLLIIPSVSAPWCEVGHLPGKLNNLRMKKAKIWNKDCGKGFWSLTNHNRTQSFRQQQQQNSYHFCMIMQVFFFQINFLAWVNMLDTDYWNIISFVDFCPQLE